MNRNQIKYIAVTAMLIDHISAFFLDITTPLGMIMRIIGRLTAPIMCYFLSEGFRHTSSKKKYGIRLFIFAVISQFSYIFAYGLQPPFLHFNMIFTLFLCWLILLANEKIHSNSLKGTAIITCAIITALSDWGIIAPLWVLGFYLFREDKNRQTLIFSLISLMHITMCVVSSITNGYNWYGELWQLGVFLFIPILYLYNSKSGSKNFFSKWFFYLFYPLHLIVIGLIKYSVT